MSLAKLAALLRVAFVKEKFVTSQIFFSAATTAPPRLGMQGVGHRHACLVHKAISSLLYRTVPLLHDVREGSPARSCRRPHAPHVPPVPSIEHWKKDQYCPVTGANFRKFVPTCM